MLYYFTQSGSKYEVEKWRTVALTAVASTANQRAVFLHLRALECPHISSHKIS